MIFSLLLAGFAACSFGGMEEKSVNAEFAYLSLTVNSVSASARDIFPTAGTELLKTLSLTGTKNGVESTIATAETLSDLLSQSIAVATGTWNFTLSAKINAVTYSATVQNVTVSKSSTNNVSFELKADSAPEAQYGAYSLNLALVGGYENVTKVTATVQTPAGATVCAEEELSLTEDEHNVKNTVLYAKGVTDADEKLAVGTYRLIVTFYGGDTGKTADGNLLLLNTYREFVHIAPGIVTTATRTVDLNEVYTITWYDFDESGAVTEADAGIFTGNAPTQFSRRSNAITLPGATKEDWLFDGWYTDEACTDGNEISQIAQNTAENLRLYPKWTEPYARVGTEYYRNLSDTLTAITDATGDVAVKLYSMVTANDLGKADTTGTIINAIKNTGANTVSLTVDSGANIVLTDCSRLFYYCEKLVSADLRGLNTSAVTNMQSMFYTCKNLTSIDLSSFDTTAVTNMASMFTVCTKLTSIDLSSFDTSAVTNMSNLFQNCYALTTIFVSEKFTTASATGSGTSMFYSDTKLVGGAGTAYNSGRTGILYARIDEGSSNPGYFTVHPGYAKVNDTMYDNKEDTISAISGATENITVTLYDLVAPADLGKADTSGTILNAIKNAGVSVALTVASWANIELSGTDCESMFAECPNLVAADLRGLRTPEATSMASMFYNCPKLTTIDVPRFDTGKVTDMTSMFSYCTALTSVDVKGFDTSAVTSMESMFCNCKALPSITIDLFETGSVTSMANMFSNCQSLTTLDLSSFDTSAVKNMTSMFDTCSSLRTITVSSGFVTTAVTSSNAMFSMCKELIGGAGTTYNASLITATSAHIDGGTSNPGYFTAAPRYAEVNGRGYANKTNTINAITNATGSITVTLYENVTAADLGKAGTSDTIAYAIKKTGATSVALTVDSGANIALSGLNCESMFAECEKLTSADLRGLDTSAVWSMEKMFYYCSGLTSVDLTGLDTSSVRSMEKMFRSCSKLTSIDLTGLDTSSVTTMANMFDTCSALTSIDLTGLDTSAVTTMTDMFNDCYALTSIDLTGLDTSSVESMEGMFSYCVALTSINFAGLDTSKLITMRNMFDTCKVLTTVNFDGLDTSSVKVMYGMFAACFALKTIIVSDSFVTTSVTKSDYMFDSCTSLVGGAGTVYDDTKKDKTYAHIDGGTANPGYFTSSANASASVSITFAGDIAIAKEEAADGTVTLTASSGFTGYTWEATPAITGASISADGKTCTFSTSALDIGYAYSIMLTATRNGIPYSTEISVVSQATAAQNASPGDQIAAMTASGTIVVTGAITGTDITSIASALKAKATEDANIKVSLDLSGTMGLTAIGNEAFQSCTALESIVLPDGLESIGGESFADCYSLKSIEIPASVTSIGKEAFSSTELTSATFRVTTGWKAGSTALSASDLADTTTAASYLKTNYASNEWTRE